MKFYKRDPNAALAGMSSLTLKQRGAYNSLIDLLYANDGDLNDDDVAIARSISCHWREWATIKRELIAMGKVRLEGGKIMARRVQETIMEASELSQKQSIRASQRWVKSENVNETNGRVMPRGNASISRSTSIAKKDSGGVFDAWWSIYPRKEGKISARKTFDRILSKKLATADDLIAGARAYSERKAGTETQYIKQPTTWLNGGHWADDVTPAAVPTGGLFGSAKPVPLSTCRDRSPEEWKQPLYLFIRQGFWRDDGVDGAPPISEGCVAPKELLDIARAIWNRQGQMPVETKYSIVTRPTPFWGDNVVALPARTG